MILKTTGFRMARPSNFVNNIIWITTEKVLLIDGRITDGPLMQPGRRKRGFPHK